jgi:hypothetical protein
MNEVKTEKTTTENLYDYFLNDLTDPFPDNLSFIYTNCILVEILYKDRILKRLLKKDIQDNYFDEHGYFKEEQRYTLDGKHIVFAHKGNITKQEVYLKYRPELPGLQFVANALNEAIYGFYLTSFLLKFTILSNNESYPVLLSLNLGPSVKSIYGSNFSELESKLDSDLFTRKCLVTSLLNPADETAANLSVQITSDDRVLLVSHDEELIFQNPYYSCSHRNPIHSKSLGKEKPYKIRVKSLIFCLDTMNDSPCQKAIHDFLQINIDNFIKQLLKQLIYYNYAVINDDNSLGLFQTKEADLFFDLQKGDPCYLKAAFKELDIPKLYIKLKMMQERLRISRLSNHFSILAIAEPVLFYEYKKLHRHFKTTRERYEYLIKFHQKKYDRCFFTIHNFYQKKADEDNSSKAAEALAKIENQFFTSQNNGYFFDNIHKYISSGYFFSDIKRIETNINQVEIRLAKIFLPTS